MRKHFTIDRSKWYRGGAVYMKGRGLGQDPMLENPAGGMCCLGQIAEQCGVSRRGRDYYYPRAIEEHQKAIPLLADAEGTSDLALEAAEINDSTSISDRTREARLKRLFADQGITLTFVGRTPRKRETR